MKATVRTAATLLALLPGIALAQTVDFDALWPETVQGLARQSAQSLPDQPLSFAEYGTEANGAKANARIYGWPLEAPQPVSDFNGPEMKRAVDSIAAAIEAEQENPAEPYEVTSPQGHSLRCLNAEQQSGAVKYLFCATPVRGRILEIQHVAMSTGQDDAAAAERATGFVTELADAMIGAK